MGFKKDPAGCPTPFGSRTKVSRYCFRKFRVLSGGLGGGQDYLTGKVVHLVRIEYYCKHGDIGSD